MTSLAVDLDPYILPVPGPDSPVVLAQWISPGNTHRNARYSERVWPLAPLIDNPGTKLIKIHWKNCPVPLLAQVRQATWTMINGRLRPTYLQDRGIRARARTSASDMQGTCYEWMRLARWLHKRRISSLDDCTEEVWRAYASERFVNTARARAELICMRLSDLWAFDQLGAQPAGIAQPPWETEGIDDFLPEAESSAQAENSTEPLDPQVLGPLLVWAIRFVDNFADDILAAWAERQRLMSVAAANRASQEGWAALGEFLLPLIRSGDGPPTVRMHGRRRLARAYVSALTGASLGQVDRFAKQHRLSALVNESPGSCPLQTPVTGLIGERSWREHMDFDEAAELMRHLGTAAAIICLYLTGMRPQEVQGLRSGCCPAPAPAADGIPGRHLIRSQHYKNVTDDDGNHISAGEERKVPWVAITPVVHAIRTLERIVPPGELLFSATHHDFVRQRNNHGALKNAALNQRVEDFAAWANREAQVQGLPKQVVPKDPHGAIGLGRFRRSLAWHIARRPGGLIALAIQYGHMRTMLDARTSSRYGSRSRHGIHSVLDIETALAAADTAAHLRDRLAAGEKVSGPAARRAITAAATTPRFEGRIVPATFAKKAAKFLARDGIVLYDNPDAFLICAFKHENALCEPEPGATAPRQYACTAGCGNTVRTDTHAAQMRGRADEIDQLAAASPEKVAKRLRINANNLRATADAHDATAQTTKALT
ncbi:integrase [Streptomyces sp. NBC_01336]|uniref:integrase n=1 Tax=Streptomyces sp. NBC_01336 TaxID=2903829 RepID=UPI002E11C124|nr:integrase [Streptomyces sp. NBC_01336]